MGREWRYETEREVTKVDMPLLAILVVLAFGALLVTGLWLSSRRGSEPPEDKGARRDAEREQSDRRSGDIDITRW